MTKNALDVLVGRVVVDRLLPLAADLQACQGPSQQSAIASCWRCAAEHHTSLAIERVLQPSAASNTIHARFAWLAKCSALGIAPQARLPEVLCRFKARIVMASFDARHATDTRPI